MTVKSIDMFKKLITLSMAAGIMAAVSVNAAAYPKAEGMKEFAVHPANNNGKMMTMGQAVYSGDLIPERFYATWFGPNSLVYRKDGKTQLFDAVTGNDIEEDEIYGKFSGHAGDYLRKELPEDADNVTPNNAAMALAYTSGKSLWYIDQRKHKYLIAESENGNITYGQTVSRNEFGIKNGIFWAPDGRSIAFYRKDETLVTDFPLLDINTRTGSLVNIKYPMNGMTSENVRVGVYNLAENSTIYLQADDFGYDQYLTNVTWSPDCRHIFIQVLRIALNAHFLWPTILEG